MWKEKTQQWKQQQESLARKRHLQEIKDIERKRGQLGKKIEQENGLLMNSRANQGGAKTTPGQIAKEMEDEQDNQDYLIMEVSEHTRQNLIPNCFGVYRPNWRRGV